MLHPLIVSGEDIHCLDITKINSRQTPDFVLFFLQLLCPLKKIETFR